MARLQGYVHVHGGVYGPDDDVPADIARLITNPKAWEGGQAPTFAPAPDPTPAPAGSGDGPARVPAPPRSGRGSGLDAWQTFAKAAGLEFADDATRDDIIAAAEKAGAIDAE
ncbi:hypothetical protein ACIBTV_27265 [Micromonospora sp. NPDC049366]|uniref:hypothetical protein n=1 Tax=Micromonospora sp. NPDC049366 TaxID=3364271 RepID=UPI00378B4AD6